jgi:hypothetical protein
MTQITLSLTESKQAEALLRYLRTLDFVKVVSVLTDEEKEDIGMAALLKEADRSKKVSKTAILQKLKAQ